MYFSKNNKMGYPSSGFKPVYPKKKSKYISQSYDLT